jgi:hypothetical protein
MRQQAGAVTGRVKMNLWESRTIQLDSQIKSLLVNAQIGAPQKVGAAIGRDGSPLCPAAGGRRKVSSTFLIRNPPFVFR